MSNVDDKIVQEPKRKHVVVTCAGSRGDCEPYIALALALRDAGVDVTIAGEKRLVPLAAGAGLPTRLLAFDMSGALFDPECAAIITGPGDPSRNAIKASSLWASKQDQDAELRSYERNQDALEGADVVVAKLFSSVGAVNAAESRNLPIVLVHVNVFSRTGAYPPPPLVAVAGALRVFTLGLGGKWANRTLVSGVSQKACGSQRARLGLRPLGPCGVSGLALRKRLPCVIACSTLILLHGALPPDAPPTVLAGCALPPSGDGRLPPAVAAFLDEADAAGTKVVSIGFGSMPFRGGLPALIALADAACAAAGVRCVLLTAWTTAGGEAAAGAHAAAAEGVAATRLLVAPEAPHGSLFPRVAASVQHAGAGTAAAALRAGCPVVPVFFIFDQWENAASLRRAGVAQKSSRKLTSANVTPANLAAAIKDALDPALAAAARAAARVRAEAAECMPRAVAHVLAATPLW